MRTFLLTALLGLVLAPLGPLTVAAADAAAADPTFRLTVEVNNDVGGSLVRAPGISCGADCTEDFIAGTVVTLTAEPSDERVFAGWYGACYGMEEPCQVTMDQDQLLVAFFNRADADSRRLVTSVVGSGRLASTPDGIDCGADCAQSFAVNTWVTLTATPAAGQRFVRWGGNCRPVTGGAGAECVVAMAADESVTAVFEPVPQSEPPPAAPPPPPLPGPCTLTGTPGRDVLVGTPGADVICGLGGRDVLRGRAGRDVLRGGRGDDTCRGGAGRDRLVSC